VEGDAMRRKGDSRYLNCSRENSSCRRPTLCLAFFYESKFEVLVISNLLLLFFAGFDTSSAMLAACLHLVAMDQDFQEGSATKNLTTM
jgi:hypothetical protein